MKGPAEKMDRGTVMRVPRTTRARLQIVKNTRGLANVNDTLVFLLDFWQKKGGNGNGAKD